MGKREGGEGDIGNTVGTPNFPALKMSKVKQLSALSGEKFEASLDIELMERPHSLTS